MFGKYSSLELISFLLDTSNQNQRFSLIQELETLMNVGRHSNVVSLVGTCSFEGNLRQAPRAVQTTNI